MPKPLKIVAQQTMDLYYQTFKNDNTDFFELQDFIDYCGNAISSLYLGFYQQEYAMLRSDKKDDVIVFDAGWLSEQFLDVKKEGNDLIACIEEPIMTFPYDRQSVGVQDVFIIEPHECNSQVERTSMSAKWRLQYLPLTNKIFWYLDINKIGFVSKGGCNVKKVKIMYVPSVNANMQVPDGLIEAAITKTIELMRGSGKDHITKTSIDNNDNKVMQSEINKLELK